MTNKDERGTSSSTTAIVVVGVLLLLGLPCLAVVGLLGASFLWHAREVPVIKPTPPILQPVPPPVEIVPEAAPVETAPPIETNPLRSEPAPEAVN